MTQVKKANICILQSEGTNCDAELFYAFKKFGVNPQYVHINELRMRTKSLKDFHVLALPGGFSYGDDIASGKILAIEMISFLKKELETFRKKDGLIIGICNGFQTLIRTGLLPFGNLGKMDATLAPNDSGHFECRWVRVATQKNNVSLIFKGKENLGWFSINHGEGKLLADESVIKEIEKQNLVVFRYVSDNPNGSINAIAGITDPDGKVLGLMPHPEKFIDTTQYPNWRREKITKPHGAFFFESIVDYLKQ